VDGSPDRPPAGAGGDTFRWFTFVAVSHPPNDLDQLPLLPTQQPRPPGSHREVCGPFQRFRCYPTSYRRPALNLRFVVALGDSQGPTVDPWTVPVTIDPAYSLVGGN